MTCTTLSPSSGPPEILGQGIGKGGLPGTAWGESSLEGVALRFERPKALWVTGTPGHLSLPLGQKADQQPLPDPG